MSQHFYITKKNNETITICMGWDRPLQGFFMVVETNKKPQSDEDLDSKYLYHNMEDEALFEYDGLCRDLEYFKKKLKKLNFSVPASMIDEIMSDAIFNVGNKTKVHA